MKALLARLRHPKNFEYVLLGGLLIVLGGMSQLGWIGNPLP